MSIDQATTPSGEASYAASYLDWQVKLNPIVQMGELTWLSCRNAVEQIMKRHYKRGTAENLGEILNQQLQGHEGENPMTNMILEAFKGHDPKTWFTTIVK